MVTYKSDAHPADILAEVNHSLGIGVRRVRYQPPDGPDISDLKAALGEELFPS